MPRVAKVLVLGGTGAMGAYLVPELLDRGFEVFVTSRSDRESNENRLHYIKGNAKDKMFLEKLIDSKQYDAIVDFMLYNTQEFTERADMLLNNTNHYLYLSSYRVYGESDSPLKEDSPRLLDTLKDKKYLETDEYALAKARQENYLFKSKRKNWTILRPAITYSKDRFFLGNAGTDGFLYRAMNGKSLIFPRGILSKEATMTWAGDAARIIAHLILKKSAFGETVNVSSSESQTWKSILDLYKEYLGVKVKLVSDQKYLDVYGLKYMYMYNRSYDRRIDNTKAQKITGIKQKDLMPLREGLRMELSLFSKNPKFGKIDNKREKKIDNLTTSTAQKLRKRISPRVRARQAKALVKRHAKYDGAIVTLTVYNNYGNVIQRFALQKFLEMNNYKYVMFDLHTGEVNKHHRHVKKFVDKYLVQEKFNPRVSKFYKTYIVGSDQIWRHFSVNKGWKNFGIQFLSFVNNPKTKRVAYAASFGVDSLEEAGIVDRRKEKVTPLIKKFDHISVREASGVQLAEELGAKKVEQVLDPTLLIQARTYSALVNRSSVKDKEVSKVFYYMIDPTDLIKSTISQYEERYETKSKGILPYLGPYRGVALPSMEKWLKSIRDAEVVVTDSYHAVIFSIIFHTPFVVFDKKGGGTARIMELLKPLGLEDRVIEQSKRKSVDIKKFKTINWEKVEGILDKKRAHSGKWLLDSLSERK